MGHHGWGHHMGGWGGGWGGWGMGWLFPALIVGKILGEAFDNPQQQPWPQQPWPPQSPQPQPAPKPQPQAQPRPAATPANSTLRCANCGGGLSAQFAFCPHCGRRIEPPACRYCGQTLDPKLNYCTHCGAPQRR
jgi:hypothetical protein